MSQNTSHAVMAQRHEAPGSLAIVTLAEARKNGSKRYFTGAPCLRGHISERLVSNAQCLACCRESLTKKDAARARYRANADEIKQRVRERWRSDPCARAKDKARRDKKRERIRAYDRMRAKRDREKKKVIIARWIENNPERSKELWRAQAHRYRARKMAAQGSHSREDIVRIFNGQKRRCWWCKKKIRQKFHVDHRIPLAKGGTNDPGNLVIACPPCNLSKNDKMPWQFAGVLL